MKIWEEKSLKISIKNEKEISFMKEGGKILGEILYELKNFSKEGINCLNINKKAEELMEKYNVMPSFKGYNGFPSTLCISINNEIVHGIPKNYILKNGDILSIDCGVLYKEFHTDSAITFPIGQIDQKTQSLISTTEKALKKAINIVKTGIRINKISKTIQDTVESKGFSVIYELTGHGIGKNLHEDPLIPNFENKELGPILREGMTIAIEPITSAGSPKIKLLSDKWTYATLDNSLSAHSEHTIAITNKGIIVLTQRPDETI